jgi:hypothetical protein
MNDLKTTDWILPWRAKRNLESLRAEIEAIKDKNEKLHAQSKAALRFLTIRHGLDFLPKLALKEPIER